MRLPSIIRRFLPTFMVAEELRSGLCFYTVIVKSDSYGNKSPRAIGVDGPDEFYEKHLFPKQADHQLRLITATRWENKHFPMVDADNERDFLSAQAFLDSNDIDYSLWESSPGRYWFLIDRWFRFGSSAVEYARSVPGCDKDYCNAANSCGFCAMRVSNKGKFALSPRMLKPAKNKEIQAFCHALQEFFRNKADKLQYLDFHRALFHKSISMTAPGQLLEKREAVRAQRGDLVSFYGSLRIVHKDCYNTPCREEIGTDLLEGVVLDTAYQGKTSSYVVYVDEDPTRFGTVSKTIKESKELKVLTPFFVATDHIVQNKGCEIPTLLTDRDFHRRRLAAWLSNAKD